MMADWLVAASKDRGTSTQKETSTAAASVYKASETSCFMKPRLSTSSGMTGMLCRPSMVRRMKRNGTKCETNAITDMPSRSRATPRKTLPKTRPIPRGKPIWRPMACGFRSVICTLRRSSARNCTRNEAEWAPCHGLAFSGCSGHSQAACSISLTRKPFISVAHFTSSRIAGRSLAWKMAASSSEASLSVPGVTMSSKKSAGLTWSGTLQPKSIT
mmetsp:Transcript_84624/g.234639  ORF Transcript_84624/g.234639 Transcript_84624/m.234639 type:complete len:215 (+) Transcript_84624:558-1202(+)